MYEAPRMTEVGSVQGLTLGKELFAPNKDGSNWFFGTSDPKPPVGSR